jgi:hypothetical protein
MRGLDPRIRVLFSFCDPWMAGSSPAMITLLLPVRCYAWLVRQ